MSTLDTKYQKRIGGYLFFTAFLIFAGFVYELYGHGVYSNYMIYAFVFPFLGLCFWIFALKCKKEKEISNNFAFSLAICLAAYSVAFIFKGVIDIYGTTSWWIYVFQGICGVFSLNLLRSIFLELFGKKKSHKQQI